MSPSSLFYGALITPKTLTHYDVFPNCLLSVGPSGIIEWVERDVGQHVLQDTLAQKGCTDVDIVILQPGEFLMPGLIDTHIHAVQFPTMGNGQKYQLLDWLKHVIFPGEAKFWSLDFAERTYKSVVRRTIDCGSTTCCYYGSLHYEATRILADTVHSSGQRAFIGKCNMDRPGECPDYYIEKCAHDSLRDTKKLIDHIRSLYSQDAVYHSHHLVQPILTPRFALSCTDELLTSLGELAASDTSLRIQTHIAENLGEVEHVKDVFPKAPHYTGVYDHFGLLRHNTILGHAVWLTDAEVKLIAKRKAGISHCPTSNFYLTSGVAHIGAYLDKGVKNASIASKVVALQARDSEHDRSSTKTKFADSPLTVATLLYLATLGGAEVCDIDKSVGSLEPGKSFDALLVNTRTETGVPGLWFPEDDARGTDRDALEGLLERFLFCGDDRNISRVYVQGRLIGGKDFPA
ncbi:hypothetical protein H0H92_014087 [Tricholoma furcatifolium]|nr:hypothetical protein H0H92_014087 [Tricholoma furcatifolium]